MSSWQANLLNIVLRFAVKSKLKHSIKQYEKTNDIAVIHRMRKLFESLPVSLPKSANIQSITIGNLPATKVTEIARPPTKTIFYLHGGAYVLGLAKIYLGLAHRLAIACSANVVLLDYRLAPEHLFPAAVEDAVMGYQWLVANEINPDRLVVAGDSAGGGLAVAMLVALKDKKIKLPAATACLSPWIDLALTGASLDYNRKKDSMLVMPTINPYLGDANPFHPLASPLYADLMELSPMLIHVGSNEILLDDAKRLATKAQANGVDVLLEVWENMPHVWHLFARFIPEARQAIANVAKFINKHVPD